MPIITIQVQTLYPHVFYPGSTLYSQPGLAIGTVMDDEEASRN